MAVVMLQCTKGMCPAGCSIHESVQSTAAKIKLAGISSKGIC